MSWWEWCGADIAAWVEGGYPEEGCGLVVTTEAGFRFLGCDNLANQHHEFDPAAYPETALTSYIVDPMEYVKAEERGEEVRLIVHSHADVGDYFSDEDVAGALVPGAGPGCRSEPSYPGVGYLVVSVRAGRAVHATQFEFDPDVERSFAAVAAWCIDEGAFEPERGGSISA